MKKLHECSKFEEMPNGNYRCPTCRAEWTEKEIVEIFGCDVLEL